MQLERSPSKWKFFGHDSVVYSIFQVTLCNGLRVCINKARVTIIGMCKKISNVLKGHKRQNDENLPIFVIKTSYKNSDGKMILNVRISQK